MKSIILKPWELKSAIEGKLTFIVRPMKVQPPKDLPNDAVAFQPYSDHPEIWAIQSKTEGPKNYQSKFPFPVRCDAIEYWRELSPYRPGETAFVKETFAYNLYGNIEYKADIHQDYWKDFHFESLLKMKLEQSRFTITWKEVKAKQATKLTMSEYYYASLLNDTPSGGENYSDAWNRHYPKHPYSENPWLWLYEVEVKHV